MPTHQDRSCSSSTAARVGGRVRKERSRAGGPPLPPTPLPPLRGERGEERPPPSPAAVLLLPSPLLRGGGAGGGGVLLLPPPPLRGRGVGVRLPALPPAGARAN